MICLYKKVKNNKVRQAEKIWYVYTALFWISTQKIKIRTFYITLICKKNIYIQYKNMICLYKKVKKNKVRQAEKIWYVNMKREVRHKKKNWNVNVANIIKYTGFIWDVHMKISWSKKLKKHDSHRNRTAIHWCLSPTLNQLAQVNKCGSIIE